MLSNCFVAAILPTTDLARAKKFYSETLGLKESGKDTEGMLMYEAGQGSMFSVYQRLGGTKADHTVMGFKVDNIEEEMADLRKRGVVFEEYDMPGLKTEQGVATMGTVKAAWFKDPDGNILSLNQM